MSDAEKENIFKDLVPHAKKVLHQQMMNQMNPKIAIQVAESILDRAGQTKKVDDRVRTPIVITNSQVAILSKVAREIEVQMENDDLFVPDSNQWERVNNADAE